MYAPCRRPVRRRIFRAIERRYALPRQRQRDRMFLLRQNHAPRLGDFVRVPGADHDHVRDAPQVT